jgi:adenosylcobinamide amidohydrolase
MIDPLLREKADRIVKGEEVVLSDTEYDTLIDAGLFEDTWASMPNPQQVGTLDVWLVADLNKSRGAICEARKQRGIVPRDLEPLPS